MLRILLVDDQKSICEMLKAILSPEADFEVVGVAHNGETAFELAKNLLPDLMLVDLEMPGLNGLDLTRVLYQYLPQIRVIILSMHDREEYVQKALKSGAMGYLRKDIPREDLTESIRFVARGYTQFSPGLINKVVPFLGTESIILNSNKKANLFPSDSKALALIQPSQDSQPQRRKSWKFYAPYWCMGNGILWLLATLFLILKNPSYRSEWAIAFTKNSGSSLAQMLDRDVVTNQSPSLEKTDRGNFSQEYNLFLRQPEIIATAAAKLKMTEKRFGKPVVKTNRDSTIVNLSIGGNSPEEARKKAIAFQESLQEKLKPVQEAALASLDRNLQLNSNDSNPTLANARQKLADFKVTIAANSENSPERIAANLENVQIQIAQVTTQREQVRSQARRLAASLRIDPQIAQDAYTLDSDAIFQRYWTEYNRLSEELREFESIFKAQNPFLVGKKEEVAAIRNNLIARGKTLLGRELSEKSLQEFNLDTAPENSFYRSNVLKQIVDLQSNINVATARLTTLNQEVTKLKLQETALQDRIKTLSQLEQEVKLAELKQSQSAANLADEVSQIVRVIKQPSLATKPSSPNWKLVYLKTLMGSVFLTLVFGFIWAKSQEKTSVLFDEAEQKDIALQS